MLCGRIGRKLNGRFVLFKLLHESPVLEQTRLWDPSQNRILIHVHHDLWAIRPPEPVLRQEDHDRRISGHRLLDQLDLESRVSLLAAPL
jgi:hypothetical protein